MKNVHLLLFTMLLMLGCAEEPGTQIETRKATPELLAGKEQDVVILAGHNVFGDPAEILLPEEGKADRDKKPSYLHDWATGVVLVCEERHIPANIMREVSLGTYTLYIIKPREMKKILSISQRLGLFDWDGLGAASGLPDCSFYVGTANGELTLHSSSDSADANKALKEFLAYVKELLK